MKKAAKTAKGYRKPSRPRKVRFASLARNRTVPSFFVSPTLDDLAEAQGVKPLADPNVLMGGWPEGEDLDEFLDETYKARTASAAP